MSDATLRELERRWKATGSVEDEAAFLLERVRVGDLTRERLELAAHCGHEAASRATGTSNGSPQALREWLSVGHELDRVTMVQLLVPLARAILVSAPRHDSDDDTEQALDAIEAWLRHPSSEHEAKAFELVQALPLVDVVRERHEVVAASAVLRTYKVMIGAHGALDAPLDPDPIGDLVSISLSVSDESTVRSALRSASATILAPAPDQSGGR